MKKILILSMLLISFSVISQNIPNGSFENWINAGPFLMPEGWSGSNNIIQSPISHSGAHSILLSVDTMTNMQMGILDTVSASAFTGIQTLGPQPFPGGMPLGGYAFTGKPDSLIGWIKFTSMQGDAFRISVQLSNWDTVSDLRNIIAEGFYSDFMTVDSFSRFAIPLMYSFSEIPDTAFIQLESADMVSKHIGTTLWVDDLDFTFGSASINDFKFNKLLSIYPNPAHDYINIEAMNNIDGYQIFIVSTLNQVLYQTQINQPRYYVDLKTFLKNGICFLKLYDLNGNLKEVRKIVLL